jgi:hypothetical protein
MTEKIIELSFYTVITSLFLLNFNSNWTNRNYEKLKSKNSTWYWFRVFKIAQTKENYVKFQKGLSIFGIAIMITGIIMVFRR